MKRSISQIEHLITEGQITEAQAHLKKLIQKKVGRENLAVLSKLARRVSLIPVSLKLLNPVVRDMSRIKIEATDVEKVEYASSLIWEGATLEAKWLISKIDRKATPSAALTLAYANMFEWNYEAAIPYLVEYLEHDLLEFDRLVGEVNLSACYIRERGFLKAEVNLAALRSGTKKSFPRLYANVLELSSQLAIFSKDFKQADLYLKEAAKIIHGDLLLDAVLIQKWALIKELFQKGASHKLIEQFNALKIKSLKLHHWETTRECDKYLSIAKKDQELFLHVYFGTPFKSYRERLDKDFKKDVIIPKSYLWRLGKETKSLRPQLNLFTGSLNGKSTDLKTGKTIHRLLYLLSSDFYKPMTTGALFGGLFPGEYFNPHTSPPRVHQTVSALKEWLKANGTGLTIPSDENGYRLISNNPFEILLTEKESRRHPQLRLLFDHFGEKLFSANEASQKLSVPLRSLQRFLGGMVAEGLLKSSGGSRSIRYQLKRQT